MEKEKFNEEKLIKGETVKEFICLHCGKQNFVFAGFQKPSKKSEERGESGYNLWNCLKCKSTFGEPTIDK